MYSYIKGTLEEIYTDHIVVENNGIGYNIFVPGRLLDLLPPMGHELKIYTYLNVREDIFQLFGFLNRDELDLFKLLITVNGIGPKGGLSILSAMDANAVRFAVAGDDAKAISKAPGVGAKTAQRVIMELKDKIDLETAIDGLTSGDAQAVSTENMHQVKKEAMEALVSLGYSAAEANRVLSGIEIDDSMDVEALLKSALKNLAFL